MAYSPVGEFCTFPYPIQPAVEPTYVYTQPCYWNFSSARNLRDYSTKEIIDELRRRQDEAKLLENVKLPE